MAQQPADDMQQRKQSGRDGQDVTSPVPAKLSAGSAALDRVLGGGIPRGSLSLVTGAPGAGKTILAQQISFATARAGMRVIYFTNVSEPHAKLVDHVSSFDFYSPDLIGDGIQIYNITSQIRNRGFRETLDFVVDSVRAEKADLVVIDSFRGLKHVLDVSVRDRASLFDMAAHLSLLGCTSLLVGEYTPTEIQTDPEFAIADGIIYLRHAQEGAQERRTLRIAKLRGVGYLGGEHSYQIDRTGMHLFPRQESLTRAPAYRATEERVSMGIPALDQMMYGGPIRSSSTLIAGSAGTGKTVLSLHFLAAGTALGERGLMVSFQENPEQLAIRAGHFGLGQQIDMENGRIHILFLSPVELDLDQAAALIREAIEQHSIQRVVIDSVAELEFAARDRERFDDFLASLVGYFRGREVTTLMTREITQLFGSNLSISSRGLSYIVDNIVLLRYIELHGEIRRGLTVLKSRGSNHDKSLRELLIEEGQVTIGGRFGGMAGLMTGIPHGSMLAPGGQSAAPDQDG